MRKKVRSIPVSPTLRALAIAAIAFALVPTDHASAAYTLKTLHSFCSRTNCTDGEQPQSRLVMDQSGTLYGTASVGGKYGNGVVFKLVPNADKSRYTEYVIHNFCRLSGCPDGADPLAGVILDVDGNVYGTALAGGRYGQGVIFKLTPGAKGWGVIVRKNFCSASGCTDGQGPATGLSYAGQDSGNAWNGSSPLFGTTHAGGTYTNGVVYELTSTGTYTVLHNFQDSSNPNEVVVDRAGNVFGTSENGGKYGGGLMYKLAAGTWHQTILHNFCNSANCPDGDLPQGRLAMDASGNLFGTTYYGGSNCTSGGDIGCGVVFERTSGGSYKVLYNFCSLANCADGTYPLAGVIVDGSGNLFGTTSVWGAYGAYDYGGTVYELSGGSMSVLYSFCQQDYCADGETPYAAVIPGSSGGLFGTTYDGGATGHWGTVFRLGP